MWVDSDSGKNDSCVCVCVGSVCTANLDKAIIGNNKCYMVFAGIRAKKRGYGAA